MKKKRTHWDSNNSFQENRKTIERSFIERRNSNLLGKASKLNKKKSIITADLTVGSVRGAINSIS